MRLILVTLLAIAIGLAGCSAKRTYSANGATVTTDESNKTVTVRSSAGTVRMGRGLVTSASLGVPIYTGATQDDNAISVQSSKGSGEMASFTTADPFEKVYAFYHSKMPPGSEKMKVDQDGSSMAEFLEGADTPGAVQTLVMISGKDGKTVITVTKGKQ